MSLQAATLGAATEAGWLLYRLQRELWSAVPDSVLMGAANVLLAMVIVGTGTAPRRSVAVALVWGSVLAGLMIAGGLELVGSLLGMAYGVQCAPAIWSAYRTRVPSGLAPTTWAITLLEAWLWGWYGAVNNDAGLLALATVGTIASVALLVRCFVTRGRTTGVG